MGQGYRLDSESKSPEINEVCSSNGEKYKGTEISSSGFKIEINFESRGRATFVGIPLIPIIPIGFGEDKNVVAIVTVNDVTQDLKTNFNSWQFSNDGKNWSSPIQVIPVTIYSDGQVLIPKDENTSSQNKRPKGFQLFSDLKIKDSEILFIRTAESSLGSHAFSPLVLKWKRESYSRYSPFLGGMDDEPKLMLICK